MLKRLEQNNVQNAWGESQGGPQKDEESVNFARAFKVVIVKHHCNFYYFISIINN